MLFVGGRSLLVLSGSLARMLLGLVVGWIVGCLGRLRMGFGLLVGGLVGVVFIFVLAWMLRKT